MLHKNLWIPYRTFCTCLKIKKRDQTVVTNSSDWSLSNLCAWILDHTTPPAEKPVLGREWLDPGVRPITRRQHFFHFIPGLSGFETFRGAHALVVERSDRKRRRRCSCDNCTASQRQKVETSPAVSAGRDAHWGGCSNSKPRRGIFDVWSCV